MPGRDVDELDGLESEVEGGNDDPEVVEFRGGVGPGLATLDTELVVLSTGAGPRLERLNNELGSEILDVVTTLVD